MCMPCKPVCSTITALPLLQLPDSWLTKFVRLTQTSFTCTTCMGITCMWKYFLNTLHKPKRRWFGPSTTAGLLQEHCSYFDMVNCYRWQTECHHCPNKHGYPASWGLDNSRRNFHRKKELFTSIDRCALIGVSEWMVNNLTKSYFQNYPIYKIWNGIDLLVFSPSQDWNGLSLKLGLSEKNSF